MSPHEAAVIVPAYRSAHTIGVALSSIEASIAASGRDVAISVVDDASDDATLEVIRDFIASSSVDVVLGVNGTNRHTAATRNVAIGQVDAEAYLFLDDDDEYLVDHVGHLLALLERSGADYAKSAVVLDDPVHPDWVPALNRTLCQNLAVTKQAHELIGGFMPQRTVARLGCNDVLYNRLLREFLQGVASDVPTVRFRRRAGKSFDQQYERKLTRAPDEHVEVMSDTRRQRLASMHMLFDLRRREVAARLQHHRPRVLEAYLDRPVRDLLPIWQQRSHRSSWAGVPMFKAPVDAWTYQELVFELLPDVVVEIGTGVGGTALYLAHLMGLAEHGEVVTVEKHPHRVHPSVRAHDRVTVLEGAALEVADRVGELTAGAATVLIIDDSSHTYEHTLGVCETYGELVTPGSYLIVEDTIFGHGFDDGPSPGPAEAVEEFLRRTDRFEIDRSREPFVLTWNPRGFLRRVR